MTAFNSADRTRLIAILGMLGSEHVGERASAGLLASRLLKERGLLWVDIIARPAPVPPSHQSHYEQPSYSGGAVWPADLALAVRHKSFCRDWEKGFIDSVSQRRTLSPKQRTVIAEIALALRARGLA